MTSIITVQSNKSGITFELTINESPIKWEDMLILVKEEQHSLICVETFEENRLLLRAYLATYPFERFEKQLKKACLASI